MLHKNCIRSQERGQLREYGITTTGFGIRFRPAHDLINIYTKWPQKKNNIYLIQSKNNYAMSNLHTGTHL